MARLRKGQVRVRVFTRFVLRCNCGWTAIRGALRSSMRLAEVHLAWFADGCVEVGIRELTKRPVEMPRRTRGWRHGS